MRLKFEDKRDKNAFLVSPSYGLCLWQIPCWCEFSFSLVSLEGFPRKWASPSRSHFGKTKYGDKIAPCGRKKYIPLERKRIGPYGEQIYPCAERMCDAPAIFFAFRRYFELYFVFLMPSGRLVWLFTGSPEGSQGNKRTWLPGMAASQTYKGRHKEVFLSCLFSKNLKTLKLSKRWKRKLGSSFFRLLQVFLLR